MRAKGVYVSKMGGKPEVEVINPLNKSTPFVIKWDIFYIYLLCYIAPLQVVTPLATRNPFKVSPIQYNITACDGIPTLTQASRLDEQKKQVLVLLSWMSFATHSLRLLAYHSLRVNRYWFVLIGVVSHILDGASPKADSRWIVKMVTPSPPRGALSATFPHIFNVSPRCDSAMFPSVSP